MSLPSLTGPADEALRAVLGETPLVRHVVHEWPLSRVERLETASGRYALKAQRLGTGVERAFYEAVDDPLLLRPLCGGRTEDAEWLLLPWINDAPEDWSIKTDAEIRRRVGELSRAFASWKGAPVSFPAVWAARRPPRGSAGTPSASARAVFCPGRTGISPIYMKTM